MDNDYMTVAEARMALGFSKSKMAKLIRDGVFKTVPDGRDSRVKLIRRSDVDTWLKLPSRKRAEVDDPKIETVAAA